MLPKHTNINDYSMNLVNNFLSHLLVLQHFLSMKRMLACDCASEADYQELVLVILDWSSTFLFKVSILTKKYLLLG